MSDTVFDRDEYEQSDDGITSPEDALDEDSGDSMLDQGYSPPERPRGLDAFGTTLAEERAGETLDQRLAQEEPDPWADPDADDLRESVGGEVGGVRAGRLVDADAGGEVDTDAELYARDIGIDGAGAAAEEAAMHVVGDGTEGSDDEPW